MDDEVYERIEAFINGDMDTAQKLQFEEELAADPLLQQRLQMYRHVQDTLSHSIHNEQNEAQLKQTLASALNAHKNEAQPAIKMRPRNNKWYYMAAAIFILMLAIFFFNQNKTTGTQQLYAQYATFPALSNERGSTDSLLSVGVEYYNNKQFAEAANSFALLYAKDTANMEVEMNLYLSYLQSNDVQHALNGFIKIASHKNVYTTLAAWYAALAYLKMDKLSECKKMLQQIPQGADTYVRAQQLLNELE